MDEREKIRLEMENAFREQREKRDALLKASINEEPSLPKVSQRESNEIINKRRMAAPIKAKHSYDESENVEDILSEVDYNREYESKRKVKPWIIYTIISLVWLGICAGSIYFMMDKMSNDRELMQSQIDTAITQMQQNTQLALDDMNERVQLMSTDMTVIIDAIADTDSAISSTGDATRKAMEAKIKELDKQLTELQKSLKILQEKSGK